MLSGGRSIFDDIYRSNQTLFQSVGFDVSKRWVLCNKKEKEKEKENEVKHTQHMYECIEYDPS